MNTREKYLARGSAPHLATSWLLRASSRPLIWSPIWTDRVQFLMSAGRARGAHSTPAREALDRDASRVRISSSIWAMKCDDLRSS